MSFDTLQDRPADNVLHFGECRRVRVPAIDAVAGTCMAQAQLPAFSLFQFFLAERERGHLPGQELFKQLMTVGTDVFRTLSVVSQ